MEKPPSAGSPNQQNKAMKKQIKVVYITNPMRVKTTAAEFKGLVQELTGQDSDIADRLCKLGEIGQVDGGAGGSAGRGSVSSVDGSLASTTVARPPDSGVDREIHEQQRRQQQRLPSVGKEVTPYMLEEDFPAQLILGDFESLIMPSTSYCEFSPAIDDGKI